MKSIILNADIGEEAGFDAQIMPYISWGNIACGSHAGNKKVIQETIDMALQHDVKIGAHPSYPDKKNFGRKSIKLPYHDLVNTITDQVELVKYYVEKAGGVLHHVKPHGALYNDGMTDQDIAKAIIEAITNIDRDLYIITPKESKISKELDIKLKLKYETFADRNYNPDLTLVSRSEKHAVITDPKKVFDHVFKMVHDQKIKTQNGVEISVIFDTICVHGDNPKSVEILKYIHQEFSKIGYRFR